MCSEYTIYVTDKNIQDDLDNIFLNSTGVKSWEQKVKFTNKAPILKKNAHGKLELAEYTFPAQPFPNSRLSGLDSKDETQIRRIYDLPTWKQGFAKETCLVPMSSFLEPVYWGNEAGTVQEFTSPNKQIIFVPGILIHGRVPKTEKAFSLLTHTANEQMLQYHHRLLVMLKPKDALEWLDLENTQDKFDFLIEKRWVPQLKVSKERDLAKGWEKRADSHLDSLASEKKYIKQLKAEGVQA